MENKNLNDEEEVLDFEDKNPQEEIEMLDFEKDEQVSNQIDEMLDFIDVEEVKTNDKTSDNLESLLDSIEPKNNNTKVEIDGSEEKLNEYKPSLKDFNIKSAKTRKIVKKSMLYIIIVMLLGFEFFINKTGEVLNNLRVYASDNQPIRIIQNNKYGYIDYTGQKVVNPKYSYGEEFVKGYAIVKNSSNLPLIINKGGKQIVPTGVYFSIYRAGNDIIASKVTKKGLKYGILDADLNIKTDFKYDMISYLGDLYTYTNGNSVGIINLDGKDIYKYKLTNSDDKTIDVSPCKVTSDSYQRYAVVKVNSSSLIVNIKDGSVVSSATLNKLIPEENNVFYEVMPNKSKRYIYVENNKVLLESDDYTSLAINSISSGVLRALTTDYKYEFISTKTMEQIKKGLSINDIYYADNVFAYFDQDKKNKKSLVLVKKGEIYKTIESNFVIEKPFKNGVAVIKFEDGLYGYLNEDGNLITNEKFIEAGEFDSYGEAICKTNNGYGVINKKGKVIIKFENEFIKMASGKVKKKSVSGGNNVFYAVRKNNRYALYNSNGKRVNKKFYNDIEFDENYPLFKAATDAEDLIITSEKLEKINLTSFNSDYKAYDNYIIVKNEYYNYSGKLIYVDNSKKEDSGD